MKPKKTIALLTSSEGHFSISEAIRQTLEAEYHVVVFKRPIFMHTMYVLMYRFFPQLFAIPYKMSRNGTMGARARRLYAKLYGGEIRSFLQQHQPDFIITTYFMYLDLLQDYAKTHGVEFLNVVANPRGLHPIELCLPQERNAIFEEWGWFVRPDYEEKYDKQTAKQELGLDPSRLTILLAGGSEGNQKLVTLLPTLLTHSQPLNVIIISGSNRALKKVIDTLITTTKPADKNVISLGFTNEMHRYLKAADVIIGKAGPNLLFEAVATHTPFVAISHISGQEDGNLDLITEYQVGLVEENGAKAATLIEKIIDQPSMLQSFSDGLTKLATHNRQAKTKLLKYLDDHLT